MEELSEGVLVIVLGASLVGDYVVELLVVLVVSDKRDEVFEEVLELGANFGEDLADVDAADHDALALQVRPEDYFGVPRKDGGLHLDASLEIERVDEPEQPACELVEHVDELLSSVVFVERLGLDLCLRGRFDGFFDFLAKDGEGRLVDVVVIQQLEEVHVADDVAHHDQEIFLRQPRLP